MGLFKKQEEKITKTKINGKESLSPKNETKFTKFTRATALLLVLTFTGGPLGCNGGGGGGSSGGGETSITDNGGDPNQDTNNEQSQDNGENQDTQTYGVAGIGINGISNAEIQIKDLSGENIIFRIQTNDEGSFDFDESAVETKLNELGIDTKIFTYETSGGTISINGEELLLLGTMKGIGIIGDDSQGIILLNAFSTILAEYIEKKKEEGWNFTPELVTSLMNQINSGDINADGNIDQDDNNLLGKVRNKIINGEVNDEIIDDILVNPIILDAVNQDGHLLLTLQGPDDSGYTIYTLDGTEPQTATGHEYNGGQIEINKGETLKYAWVDSQGNVGLIKTIGYETVLDDAENITEDNNTPIQDINFVFDLDNPVIHISIYNINQGQDNPPLLKVKTLKGPHYDLKFETPEEYLELCAFVRNNFNRDLTQEQIDEFNSIDRNRNNYTHRLIDINLTMTHGNQELILKKGMDLGLRRGRHDDFEISQGLRGIALCFTGTDTAIWGERITFQTVGEYRSFINDLKAHYSYSIDYVTNLFEGYDNDFSFQSYAYKYVGFEDGKSGDDEKDPVVADTIEDKTVNVNIDEDGKLIAEVNTLYKDIDNLTYSKIINPLNGNLELSSDGNYTYEPNENFNGNDSFIIKLSNTDGDEGEILVKVTVNSQPDYSETIYNYSSDIQGSNIKIKQIDDEELRKQLHDIVAQITVIQSQIDSKEQIIETKQAQKVDIMQRINQLEQTISDLIKQIEELGGYDQELQSIKTQILSINWSNTDAYIKSKLQEILNELNQLTGSIPLNTTNRQTSSVKFYKSDLKQVLSTDVSNQLLNKINYYQNQLDQIEDNIVDKKNEITNEAKKYNDILNQAQDMIDTKEGEIRDMIKDFNQWESDANKYLEARKDWENEKNKQPGLGNTLHLRERDYENAKGNYDDYAIDYSSNKYSAGQSVKLGENHHKERRIKRVGQFSFNNGVDYPAQTRLELYNNSGRFIKQIGPIQINRRQALIDFAEPMAYYAKAYINLEVNEENIKKYRIKMDIYGGFSGLNGQDVEDMKQEKENNLNEIKKEAEERKDMKRQTEKAKQTAINRLKNDTQKLRELKDRKDDLINKIQELKAGYEQAKSGNKDTAQIQTELLQEKLEKEEEKEKKENNLNEITVEINQNNQDLNILSNQLETSELIKVEIKTNLEQSEGYIVNGQLVLGGKIFTIKKTYNVDTQELAESEFKKDIQQIKNRIKLIEIQSDEGGSANAYYLSKDGTVSFPMLMWGNYSKNGYYGTIETKVIKNREEYFNHIHKTRNAIENINIIGSGEYNGVLYNIFEHKQVNESGQSKLWIKFSIRGDLLGDSFYEWGGEGEYIFNNIDLSSFIEDKVKASIHEMVNKEIIGYRQGEYEGYGGGTYTIYKHEDKIWGVYKVAPNGQARTTPLKSSIAQAENDMKTTIDNWIYKTIQEQKTEEQATQEIQAQEITNNIPDQQTLKNKIDGLYEELNNLNAWQCTEEERERYLEQMKEEGTRITNSVGEVLGEMETTYMDCKKWNEWNTEIETKKKETIEDIQRLQILYMMTFIPNVVGADVYFDPEYYKGYRDGLGDTVYGTFTDMQALWKTISTEEGRDQALSIIMKISQAPGVYIGEGFMDSAAAYIGSKASEALYRLGLMKYDTYDEIRAYSEGYYDKGEKIRNVPIDEFLEAFGKLNVLIKFLVANMDHLEEITGHSEEYWKGYINGAIAEIAAETFLGGAFVKMGKGAMNTAVKLGSKTKGFMKLESLKLVAQIKIILNQFGIYNINNFALAYANLERLPQEGRDDIARIVSKGKDSLSTTDKIMIFAIASDDALDYNTVKKAVQNTYGDRRFILTRAEQRSKYVDKVTSVGYTYDSILSKTGLNRDLIKRIKDKVNGGKPYLGYLLTLKEKGIPLSKYDEEIFNILKTMNPEDIRSIQKHHFMSSINNNYSPQFNNLIEKYGYKLDLEGDWNLGYVINHRGSHGGSYSRIMSEEFKNILDKGHNQEKVIELFEDLKIDIINNPSNYDFNI